MSLMIRTWPIRRLSRQNWPCFWTCSLADRTANRPRHGGLNWRTHRSSSQAGAGPLLDAAFLAALPGLEAVFYAAGSVRGLVSDAFWRRDLPLCSAWGANAVPVAEFTLAQVILCLKHTYQRSRATHAARQHVSAVVPPGNYGSRVGLIGLGMIGRAVAELLKVLKVEVWAYDPVADPAKAAALGVTLVELDALFRECDVVSLHAPALDSTRGMVTGEHFLSMKARASFINTARGSLVREPEMLAVLEARPDLFAVLDVTAPEPPVPGLAPVHPAQRFF